MQRWKSNPIPCYVHSPQKSYASSSSADYRGAICQSLLSDRSILSNAPCRLSDNRAVLTVCHDSCLNRGPIRRRFQVWLMSLYPFYLFTNWKFLQWRLILAWQTLELEKDLKGPIWTPWIVLDRLGSSWIVLVYLWSNRWTMPPLPQFCLHELQNVPFPLRRASDLWLIGPKDPPWSWSFPKKIGINRDKWW